MIKMIQIPKPKALAAVAYCISLATSATDHTLQHRNTSSLSLIRQQNTKPTRTMNIGDVSGMDDNKRAR
jgi:hypothetical protein